MLDSPLLYSSTDTYDPARPCQPELRRSSCHQPPDYGAASHTIEPCLHGSESLAQTSRRLRRGSAGEYAPEIESSSIGLWSNIAMPPGDPPVAVSRLRDSSARGDRGTVV